MRSHTAWSVCAGLLVVGCAPAGDPPYLGRWKVNEDKTDYGPAFNFTRTASGDVLFTQGDQRYVIRLDGQEYPHPFGGMESWRQLDAGLSDVGAERRGDELVDLQGELKS